MRIVWSGEARRQLLALMERISLDAPMRAVAYADKIESRTRRLARFPKSGRIVPELREEPDPPREILIDDYRLVYKIREKEVYITHLFHGMRQLPRLPNP